MFLYLPICDFDCAQCEWVECPDAEYNHISEKDIKEIEAMGYSVTKNNGRYIITRNGILYKLVEKGGN